MRITSEVDLEELFDNLDTDELCTELITRKDWHKQLNYALTIKNKEKFTCEFRSLSEFNMKDVIDQFKQGKDIDVMLKTIAYDHYGLII